VRNDVNRPARLSVLGCPIDRLTIPETMTWMSEAIASRRPQTIAVVNANKLYQMAHNDEFRAIVTSADLIIPEWAMVWAARRLKLPPLVHSGGLLVARAFLPFAEERGLRPFFLGARPETIQALQKRLRTEHPRLKVAGAHHGYLSDPAVEASTIAMIQEARPDVLFLAMGSPLQERWLARHRAALNVPVSIGIGGALDVLSGVKPDSPSWTRGRGLEWVYRMALDPAKYARRYAVTNSWFVAQVLKAILRGQRT
jgi:N-acetylglucosaminyldiphosphoundecaprenol N-acetyl-beta-D-mannosaminyltransferase